jgi:hypothetical protein
MTTTVITDLVPRTPASVRGEVVSIEAHASPPTYLGVTLADATGAISLLFQGRTELPGVQTGSLLRVDGTPWQMGELLVMLNPRYEFSD